MLIVLIRSLSCNFRKMKKKMHKADNRANEAPLNHRIGILKAQKVKKSMINSLKLKRRSYYLGIKLLIFVETIHH